MDKQHIGAVRRDNLIRLKAEAGATSLSVYLDMDRGQISKLCGTQFMGEELARDIEAKAGKPVFWMDKDRASPKYAESVECVDVVLAEEGVLLSPTKRDRFHDLAFELYHDYGADVEQVKMIILLLAA